MPPAMTLHAWLRFDAIDRMLPPDVERVLEIGVGKGAVGSILASRYSYVGLEPDPESFAAASALIGGVVLRESEEDFSDGPFDLVCAFEVLEHVEDDESALRQWQRHLRPGGSLMVSVPAGTHRFGPTDEKAGHYRRYDKPDLVAKLGRAGFSDVEVTAYGFPLGFALETGRNVVARRMTKPASIEERTAGSGRWLQAPDWASTPLWLAAAPFRLIQRPFDRLGTGLVARGRLR
jgi:SAM-dependent methyltransferase